MLRRLSDVTIGSIEKFLKIGNSEENGGKNEKEKKRKLTESVCEEVTIKEVCVIIWFYRTFTDQDCTLFESLKSV